MRIVFFEFVTHFGGAPRSVVEFASRLKAHAEVAIIDPYGCCEEFAEAVRSAGVDYHVLSKTNTARHIGGQGRPLYRLWRFAASTPDLLGLRNKAGRLLTQLQPSLVSSNNLKSASIIGSIRALRYVPLVIHLRGWYTPDMMPWYGRRLCNRRAAALLAVSHATRTALICSGIDRRKIHVLHNPVDVADMQARADRPLAAPLPQQDRAFKMLIPASIIRTKGQHTAIEAMPLILKQVPDSVLWIAGDCVATEHQQYLPSIKQLATRLGVADRVEWLGSRRDIPQIVKTSDVVLLPTHTEGHPRALLEAMALAKPVAATPVGGILDTISPNLTGLLFEVDDYQGLAAAAVRYAKDAAFACEVGRRAREFVTMNFSCAHQTARAMQIFSQLTPGRP